MNHNERSRDEIYLKLKEEIGGFQNRYILLERLLAAVERLNSAMPAYLQSPEGRAAFHEAMTKLIAEEFISPVGSKPHTAQGLHLKYRINKRREKKDNELAAQIIRSIEPPAAVDYYLKNTRDFLHDREIIAIISAFLRRENKDPMTVNERAYELFGDEKFFKGAGKNRSRGETVLKRLGLTFSSMGCEETVEPFFSFQRKDFHELLARNVYIVENKDTFWSFKRNIMDCSSSFKIDMLVYGEGKKIISSFKFMDEYDLDPQTDVFFYFGDLDPEGINIYCELTDAYPEYRLLPFREGYEAVLEIGLQKGTVKTPREQMISSENIDRFGQLFVYPIAVKVKELLQGGLYIPQEALSATAIKERFWKDKKDD